MRRRLSEGQIPMPADTSSRKEVRRVMEGISRCRGARRVMAVISHNKGVRRAMEDISGIQSQDAP